MAYICEYDENITDIFKFQNTKVFQNSLIRAGLMLSRFISDCFENMFAMEINSK